MAPGWRGGRQPRAAAADGCALADDSCWRGLAYAACWACSSMQRAGQGGGGEAGAGSAAPLPLPPGAPQHGGRCGCPPRAGAPAAAAHLLQCRAASAGACTGASVHPQTRGGVRGLTGTSGRACRSRKCHPAHTPTQASAQVCTPPPRPAVAPRAAGKPMAASRSCAAHRLAPGGHRSHGPCACCPCGSPPGGSGCAGGSVGPLPPQPPPCESCWARRPCWRPRRHPGRPAFWLRALPALARALLGRAGWLLATERLAGGRGRPYWAGRELLGSCGALPAAEWRRPPGSLLFAWLASYQHGQGQARARQGHCGPGRQQDL